MGKTNQKLSKLKSLFWISRPISWVNTAYPFAAGYIFTGGEDYLTLIVGSLFFLIPYNLMMYGVNDVFDYESDLNNPRKGGIEGAIAQKKLHPFILKSVVWSNIPFIFVLGLFGDFNSSLVLALLIFFVLAYSMPKLRFKEIPVLDSITSSIHFVGPLVFALFLTNSLIPALPYVMAFFLWGLASQSFGAIQDILPDKKAGIGSIATVLGARNTVYFSLVLYMLSTALVFMQNTFGSQLVACAGLLYVVNTLQFINVTDKTSEKTNIGWKRFIWLNYFAGFAVTISLILTKLFQ